MNIIAFLLILIAAILFGLGAFGINHPRLGLQSAGLCLLAVGLIFQFASTSHALVL